VQTGLLVLVALAGYLVGAVPFGYLVARARWWVRKTGAER
jgi:glycerol-3-phosphate acyltransferase PlsY